MKNLRKSCGKFTVSQQSASNDITADGGAEELAKFLRGLGLRKRPHDLGNDRLRRHIVCLGKLVLLLDLQTYAVNGHIAALVRDLGRDDDADTAADEHFDLIGKFVAVVIRKTAHAEAFDDDRVAMLCGVIEDARTDAGNEFDDEHGGVERIVEADGLGVMLADVVAHSACADDADLGIIDAGKGVEALGPVFACACAGDDLAVKDDMYAAGVGVSRVTEGLQEIVARVGVAFADGDLRACQNDGLLAVLNEIIEHRGGVCHRIRTVCDDEAVVVEILRADITRDLKPIFGAHIGAVELEELNGGNLANVLDLGNLGEQVFGGDFWGKSRFRGHGSDRAACGDEQNMFHKKILSESFVSISVVWGRKNTRIRKVYHERFHFATGNGKPKRKFLHTI